MIQSFIEELNDRQVLSVVVGERLMLIGNHNTVHGHHFDRHHVAEDHLPFSRIRSVGFAVQPDPIVMLVVFDRD